MFKVELRIVHKTCWGSDISLKFTHNSFSSVDCRSLEKEVVHIVHCKGDPSQFKDIIAYFKKRKDVQKTELLSYDAENVYIRVRTTKNKEYDQFSHLFFLHHLFPIAPTRFVGNEEIWSLGTADKKNITTVYNILKKLHPLKIGYIKEDSLSPNLTQKQYEAISQANLLGYYSWPRKVTITKIAKITSIPKTVFLSHIRKAEQKIMKQFLQNE